MALINQSSSDPFPRSFLEDATSAWTYEGRFSVIRSEATFFSRHVRHFFDGRNKKRLVRQIRGEGDDTTYQRNQIQHFKEDCISKNLRC